MVGIIRLLVKIVLNDLPKSRERGEYTQYGPIKNGPIKNQHSDFEKNKEPVVRILGLKNRFAFQERLSSGISGLKEWLKIFSGKKEF